jgi:hypothetical protein
MRIRTIAIAVVISSFLLSSSAIAQQRHIVETAAMNRAVVAQTATDQQNRDVITKTLHQPRVSQMAARLGLDVKRAEGAVATLSGPELARVADQARAANADLSGGSQVVVISTTTILLIIIIIILLVK